MKPLLNFKEALVVAILLVANQYAWAAEDREQVNQTRQVSASERIYNVGGSIHNRLTSDEPVRASYGPTRRLKFSTGEGAGSVALTTLSGRVELNRN